MKNHITGLVAIIVVALQFIVDNVYKFLTQSRVLGTTRTGMLSSSGIHQNLRDKKRGIPRAYTGSVTRGRVGHHW